MKPLSFIIQLVLRLALAAIFLWAGVGKFLQPEAFVVAVTRFEILPPVLIIPFVLALPLFEIISALALLAGPWKRQAAFNLIVLCLLFLLALFSAWMRGIKVECSCFGSLSSASLPWLIARDILLLGIAAVVYRGLNQPPAVVRCRD